ncbi:transmembrane protein 220 isoform X1 [Scleropages formosus]|uniref:Transmembrane protein 220 n=1 Tax=Scleropages formosus TaxID=113540 RepID=A0A8C9W4V9_SCLFO|nr:transmembrane protein 220 isoform X1 [Scleropages formosus]
MDKWEVDCFSLVWRTCNVLMALFFSLATYVQKNDPDAALWMVGYGIPAASCLLISIKGNATDIVLWRRLVDLHILVSTSIATLLGWTLLRRQSENILQQEEGREFCGLVLIVIWLLLCRMSRRKVGGVIHLFTAVTITLFPLVMWLYYYVNDDLRASWPSHCKTAL